MVLTVPVPMVSGSSKIINPRFLNGLLTLNEDTASIHHDEKRNSLMFPYFSLLVSGRPFSHPKI